MKKRIIMVSAMILLLWPVITFAAPIGTGELSITVSEPSQYVKFPNLPNGQIGIDFNATYTINGNENKSEAYCVQETHTPHGSPEYDYWAIDDSLERKTRIDYDLYIQATWLAEWGLEQGTDQSKGIAQLAIWELLFETQETTHDLTSGNMQSWDYSFLSLPIPKMRELATSATNLLTSMEFEAALENGHYKDFAHLWLLAVNPTGEENPIDPQEDCQNYLVRNPNPPNPVPVPGAIWIMGIGLMGITRIVKKFR